MALTIKISSDIPNLETFKTIKIGDVVKLKCQTTVGYFYIFMTQNWDKSRKTIDAIRLEDEAPWYLNANDFGSPYFAKKVNACLHVSE